MVPQAYQMGQKALQLAAGMRQMAPKSPPNNFPLGSPEKQDSQRPNWEFLVGTFFCCIPNLQNGTLSVPVGLAAAQPSPPKNQRYAQSVVAQRAAVSVDASGYRNGKPRVRRRYIGM